MLRLLCGAFASGVVVAALILWGPLVVDQDVSVAQACQGGASFAVVVLIIGLFMRRRSRDAS